MTDRVRSRKQKKRTVAMTAPTSIAREATEPKG